MDNYNSDLMDVVGMSDFEDTLNGIDEDTDIALLNYITKTRSVIAKHPEMFRTQQDSEQMLQMYDYLLANWNTDNRVQAIQILAAKEKELFKDGFINYDTSDLDISDLADNTGFFSVLAELYEDEINELNGLFSKLKKFGKKVVKKHIDIFKKIIPKLNKVNPLTIAVRNALRGLFALNFLGIATSLNSKKAKTKGVLAKVSRMYKNMGGKEAKLMSAIRKGAKRKALFNKKMQRKIESGNLKGTDEDLGELGEPFTIGGMIVAAGGFFLKIWNWVKKAGVKVKEVAKNLVPLIKPKAKKQEEQQTQQYTQQDNIQTPDVSISTGKSNDMINNYGTKNNTSDEPNKWKPVLIATGIIGVLGGGYLWWNSKNKSSDKLQGFALQ